MQMEKEISVERIIQFHNHPFKILHDEKMNELIESISENGILVPIIVRTMDKDRYQLIAGHRRLYAAKIAGLRNVPARIMDVSDDEAIIAMIDTNIQRETILPSERAYAYKMKLEAMKRQAERRKLISGHNVQKLSTDFIGEQNGMTGRQVRRYIRLTYLLPELLKMVDKEKIPFTVGVEISYLDHEIQKWIFEYIKDHGFIKADQVSALRKEIEAGGVMTQQRFISIFQRVLQGKKIKKRVLLDEEKLHEYFPETFTEREMKQIIEELLGKWKAGYKFEK